MKALAAVIPFLLACIPAAFADEASKNTKIEELLKLTNADRMVSQMFDQIKTMELSQLNKDVTPADRQAAQEVQDRILKLLQDTLSWDKMKPMMVKVYADTFTEEEVDGILNFYESPAGQAMLQKMPTLLQRSMAMGQQMLADVTPQIQKIMQDMQKKAGEQKSGGDAAPPSKTAPPK